MSHTTELQRNHVLVFEGGTLTVKSTDKHVSERWGKLVIDVTLPSWEDEHATIKIPPSELIALRDFLNKVFADAPRTRS